MTGWAARVVDDGQRVRTLRLLVLRGEERRLDHQRALLRQALGFELQRHCRNEKTAKALQLEEQIREAHDAWMMTVGEIREIEAARTAA